MFGNLTFSSFGVEIAFYLVIALLAASGIGQIVQLASRSLAVGLVTTGFVFVILSLIFILPRLVT